MQIVVKALNGVVESNARRAALTSDPEALAAEAEITNTPEDVLSGETPEAPLSPKELLDEAMVTAKASGLTKQQIMEKMVQDEMDGELSDAQMLQLAATLNEWASVRVSMGAQV